MNEQRAHLSTALCSRSVRLEDSFTIGRWSRRAAAAGSTCAAAAVAVTIAVLVGGAELPVEHPHSIERV